MGFLKRIRAVFHDDWCSQCQSEMDMVKKQLYALPGTVVGSYEQHKDAEYFKNHLVRVQKKAEIPTGTYACGIHHYSCPECGHRAVKLTVFLPVREQEKAEQYLYFDKGEMDGFDL